MKYLSRPEELVLLTIWKMKEEPYGVTIRKFISDMTNKYWSIGSVYVPLDRLEAKGYVTSYLADPTPERGGKSKRYYKLTEGGLLQLQEIQKVYAAFWNDIPDLSTERI
jgi:DNA-binding PadR family transcriptional regulator